MKNKGDFKEGVKAGIPIGLGYLSVSFTFGMLAVSMGLPTLGTVLISMTNLTSAGQVAGLSIIAVGGSFFELALSQFIINLRYALMSLTLSQKLQEDLTIGDKLFMSIAITDEIFAVMAAKKEAITKEFYMGLALLPYIGWSGGTMLGALFSNLIPSEIAGILGIALYGMFLAIIIPPSKKSKGVLVAVLIACALSLIIMLVPFLQFISSGIAVIICAVIASAVCAKFFPVVTEVD